MVVIFKQEECMDISHYMSSMAADWNKLDHVSDENAMKLGVSLAARAVGGVGVAYLTYNLLSTAFAPQWTVAFLTLKVAAIILSHDLIITGENLSTEVNKRGHIKRWGWSWIKNEEPTFAGTLIIQPIYMFLKKVS